MAKAMRTSISVPPELKARMDAVDEAVNWSAVACRAFEQKLAEIAQRRGMKDMRDVVARLRASKAKMEEGRYKDGYAAGQEWAKERAEAEELDRLETVRQQASNDWDTMFYGGSSAYSIGERFVFWIDPNAVGVRQAASDFWEHETGDDYEALMGDPDFVRGFAEGALDTWDEVKDQL